jgi:hypothetical protein
MNAPHAISPGSHLPDADRAWERDPARHLVLVVVALIAFIAGLVVRSSSGQAPGGSRIVWPSSESLKPHPRSIQP